MIAKVVSIESGSAFTDGHRRITLKFEAGDLLYQDLRFSEAQLPTELLGLELDYEIDVQLVPKGVSHRAPEPGN